MLLFASALRLLEAYAMNNLIKSAADDRRRAWSPDGTKIASWSAPNSTKRGIFTLEVTSAEELRTITAANSSISKNPIFQATR